MIDLRSKGLNYYHLVLVVNVWLGWFSSQMGVRLPVPTSHVHKYLENLICHLLFSFLLPVHLPLLALELSAKVHLNYTQLCNIGFFIR